MSNNETFADEPLHPAVQHRYPTVPPEFLESLFTQVKYALDVAIYAHSEIYATMLRIRPYELQFTQEQSVDMCLFYREVERYLDDIRKECKHQKEYLEKIVVMRWTNDPENTGEPIRTERCTATPDIKTAAAIPTYQKHPEQYEALMRYLGVDPQLWDRGKVLTELGEEETAVLKINWPGFTAFLTKLLAAGHPVPDGIDADRMYAIPKLSIRKAKGVQLTDSTSIKELTSLSPSTED